jgi:hypothetical protein
MQPSVFIGTCDMEGQIHLAFPMQQRAVCKRHLAGQCIEVEVRLQSSRRSDRQNRALWALLSPWAKARGWQVDELKDVMLGIAFGRIEHVMPLTGEITQVLAKPRSSRLNVVDFCHLIEEVLRVAAEDDYWLEAPDEYRKAKEAAARKKVA